MSQQAKARTLIRRKGPDYHQIHLPGDKDAKAFA
jgi:hypothetical protein